MNQVFSRRSIHPFIMCSMWVCTNTNEWRLVWVVRRLFSGPSCCKALHCKHAGPHHGPATAHKPDLYLYLDCTHVGLFFIMLQTWYWYFHWPYQYCLLIYKESLASSFCKWNLGAYKHVICILSIESFYVAHPN